MKAINKRQNKLNNRGAAMMVAIVVSIVITVLCLSLILITYSLYTSTFNKSIQNQCKELAKSLSLEIQEEITNPDFETYSAQDTSVKNGENKLWFYLRYNVWQSGWPYLNTDERGHTTPYAYRYFDLTYDETGNLAGMADNISVCIYWESEREVTAENKDGTPLYIEITCEKGGQSYTITSAYELKIDHYSDIAWNEGEEDIAEKDNGNYSGENPVGNSITKAEKWKWTFTDRE